MPHFFLYGFKYVTTLMPALAIESATNVFFPSLINIYMHNDDLQQTSQYQAK